MRRLLAALLLLLAAGAARAEFAIPDFGLVVDRAEALPAAERSEVEGALRLLAASDKGAAMAVLIVDTIPDGDIESYSLAVARAWKLGHQGRDDGLLLVHAVKDHRYRFEVGIGLQGEINDAAVGDIGRQALVPALQAGDLRAAYLGAIAAVSARLGGPEIAVPATRPKPETAPAPVEAAPAASTGSDFGPKDWVMLACGLLGGVLLFRNFWLVVAVPGPLTATILSFMTLPAGESVTSYAILALLIAGFVAILFRNPMILVDIFFRVLFGAVGSRSSSSSSDSSSSSGGSFDGGGASGKY